MLASNAHTKYIKSCKMRVPIHWDGTKITRNDFAYCSVPNARHLFNEPFSLVFIHAIDWHSTGNWKWVKGWFEAERTKDVNKHYKERPFPCHHFPPAMSTFRHSTTHLAFLLSTTSQCANYIINSNLNKQLTVSFVFSISATIWTFMIVSSCIDAMMIESLPGTVGVMIDVIISTKN